VVSDIENYLKVFVQDLLLRGYQIIRIHPPKQMELMAFSCLIELENGTTEVAHFVARDIAQAQKVYLATCSWLYHSTGRPVADATSWPEGVG
jgi:hypothetical protein